MRFSINNAVLREFSEKDSELSVIANTISAVLGVNECFVAKHNGNAVDTGEEFSSLISVKSHNSHITSLYLNFAKAQLVLGHMPVQKIVALFDTLIKKLNVEEFECLGIRNLVLHDYTNSLPALVKFLQKLPALKLLYVHSLSYLDATGKPVEVDENHLCCGLLMNNHKYLHYNAPLCALILANTGITSKLLTKMCKEKTTNWYTYVQSLSLCDDKLVGDRGMVALLTYLTRGKTALDKQPGDNLRLLQLQNINLRLQNADVARFLVDRLKLTCIEQLDISRNPLDGFWVPELRRFLLADNKYLHTLDMSNCQLPCSTALDLMEGVSDLTEFNSVWTLKLLDLGNNPATADSRKTLTTEMCNHAMELVGKATKRTLVYGNQGIVSGKKPATEWQLHRAETMEKGLLGTQTDIVTMIVTARVAQTMSQMFQKEGDTHRARFFAETADSFNYPNGSDVVDLMDVSEKSFSFFAQLFRVMTTLVSFVYTEPDVFSKHIRLPLHVTAFTEHLTSPSGGKHLYAKCINSFFSMKKVYNTLFNGQLPMDINNRMYLDNKAREFENIVCPIIVRMMYNREVCLVGMDRKRGIVNTEFVPEHRPDIMAAEYLALDRKERSKKDLAKDRGKMEEIAVLSVPRDNTSWHTSVIVSNFNDQFYGVIAINRYMRYVRIMSATVPPAYRHLNEFTTPLFGNENWFLQKRQKIVSPVFDVKVESGFNKLLRGSMNLHHVIEMQKKYAINRRTREKFVLTGSFEVCGVPLPGVFSSAFEEQKQQQQQQQEEELVLSNSNETLRKRVASVKAYVDSEFDKRTTEIQRLFLGLDNAQRDPDDMAIDMSADIRSHEEIVLAITRKLELLCKEGEREEKQQQEWLNELKMIPLERDVEFKPRDFLNKPKPSPAPAPAPAPVATSISYNEDDDVDIIDMPLTDVMYLEDLPDLDALKNFDIDPITDEMIAEQMVFNLGAGEEEEMPE